MLGISSMVHGLLTSAPFDAAPVSSVTIACVGIFFAWTLYRRGLEDPETDPLDRKLGPIGRLFGHAYYFDEGISRLVDGPLRRLWRCGSCGLTCVHQMTN